MILEGTTSSGAVVPVQVTTDGKVVAEGRTGPEGPQGPEGPEGPQGPVGPAGSPGNLWGGSDPGSIYYTGGAVGIGTSTPNTILHLYDGAGASDQTITFGNPANTPEGQIKYSAGDSEFLDIKCRGTNSSYGNIRFFTGNDGSSGAVERMRIDSQGDVVFQGALIIKSPDGGQWAIEVDNNGNLSASFVI